MAWGLEVQRFEMKDVELPERAYDPQGQTRRPYIAAKTLRAARL
jgi:hypothetical protein